MFRSIIALLAALAACSPAMAYDEALAASYQQFFASFAEKDTAKALRFMPPEKVVEMINQHKDLVLLDVRTKREQSLVGVTYPHTLHLPMDQVFKPASLAQIPTDRPVVVTCKSGVRCTAIAFGLRNIGFENVYSMKGGLIDLMKYLSPKTAF